MLFGTSLNTCCFHTFWFATLNLWTQKQDKADKFLFARHLSLRQNVLNWHCTHGKIAVEFVGAGVGYLFEGRPGHHLQYVTHGLQSKPVLFKWHPLDPSFGWSVALLVRWVSVGLMIDHPGVAFSGLFTTRATWALGPRSRGSWLTVI